MEPVKPKIEKEAIVAAKPTHKYVNPIDPKTGKRKRGRPKKIETEKKQ